ncbi:unnamed protein product [Closterium sp. NIES-53]
MVSRSTFLGRSCAWAYRYLSLLGLSRASGARCFLPAARVFLPRASGARWFSARRAALQSARRPACPSCAPWRATVPCPSCAPRRAAVPSPVAAHRGPRPPPPPPPFPVTRRGALGGRASPLLSPVMAPWGPRIGPSRLCPALPCPALPYLALLNRGPAPVFVAALPCPARPCSVVALPPSSLQPCPVAAPAAALPCVGVWGWRVWGCRVCAASPAPTPPPSPSPTAAAAAEGGGYVGADGVVLGGGV